jgi:disulfide oxidoreductase YuzD
MNTPISVQIVGAQVACAKGTKDSWRDVAAWVSGKLKVYFGDGVKVKYYDLFDPACPPIPVDAQLPLVIVEGEVLSSGGRISVPAIQRKILSIMEKQTV